MTKWSFVMKTWDGAVRGRVECREQHGRGDQCASWMCAVVCRPDHVVHGRNWNRIANALRGWSATSVSGVFPEGRKVDVDSGNGSLLDTNDVMVEAGHAMDVEVIQRCFREFWTKKKRGLRVRVPVLRETENIRMSQDAAGPRHVTVEGAEGNKGRSGELSQMQPSERIRSNRDLAETRCVDMVNVDLNALDIGSVLLLEKITRFRLESIRVLQRLCSLIFQVLCGSECSKGEKQAPRCVNNGNPRMAETCEVVVAVSENDMSHEAFFPSYDEGTQACAYLEGCGTKLELE